MRHQYMSLHHSFTSFLPDSSPLPIHIPILPHLPGLRFPPPLSTQLCACQVTTLVLQQEVLQHDVIFCALPSTCLLSLISRGLLVQKPECMHTPPVIVQDAVASYPTWQYNHSNSWPNPFQLPPTHPLSLLFPPPTPSSSPFPPTYSIFLLLHTSFSSSPPTPSTSPLTSSYVPTHSSSPHPLDASSSLFSSPTANTLFLTPPFYDLILSSPLPPMPSSPSLPPLSQFQ